MKLIELLGLPNTGKTTTAVALVDQLSNQGYKAKLIHERAGISPLKDKLHPRFNLWTTISLIKAVVEAEDKGIDFLIADRGLLDASIWIELFCNKGGFELEQSSFYHLSSIGVLTRTLMIGYFYNADLKLVIDREKHSNKIQKQNRIVNHDTLSKYLDAYQMIHDQFSVPVLEINTTYKSVDETISKVSKDLEHRILNNEINSRSKSFVPTF